MNPVRSFAAFLKMISKHTTAPKTTMINFNNRTSNGMNYKNFFQSKLSTKILCGAGALVIALLIFQAGIFVGYRKASFSYGSGDNFHRMFGAPERRGMMDRDGMLGLMGGEFTSAYGATGTVVKINLPTIIIAGTDKVEKVVVVNEKTILRQFRNDVKNEDLKVGDSIIVIGSPNASAQIEAKLIRIMSASNGLNATSTTK